MLPHHLSVAAHIQRLVPDWERRKKFDKPIKGVEIGVYKGELSVALLDLFPLLKLILIDPWASYPTDHAYRKSGDVRSGFSQEKWDKIYKGVIDKTRFALSRREMMRMESVQAADYFQPASFDFVFIDGDHQYEGCRADIRAWLPKVRAQGFLGGHDFSYAGVERAVRDEFDDNFERDIGDTWWVRT